MQSQASATAPVVPPPVKRSLLLPFLIGFAVLLLGAIALRYFSDSGRIPTRTARSSGGRLPNRLLLVATVEPRPWPRYRISNRQWPRTIRWCLLRVPRRRRRPDVRKRGAREQNSNARRWRRNRRWRNRARRERAEQERLRAEQEAAEARARPAAAAVVLPAAKGPTSPQDVCADEQSVFSRGACEGRVCAEPHWRGHPFCVKRWQDELRKLSPSGNDG